MYKIFTESLAGYKTDHQKQSKTQTKVSILTTIILFWSAECMEISLDVHTHSTDFPVSKRSPPLSHSNYIAVLWRQLFTESCWEGKVHMPLKTKQNKT